MAEFEVARNHFGICIIWRTYGVNFMLVSSTEVFPQICSLSSSANKGRERYLINAQKSVEVLLSLFKKLLDMEQVTLDDILIPQESDTVHLGVDRNLKGNGNTEKKAQIGQRTMYALMGAGAYGSCGLNPLVSSKMWKTFALPRMLYGLEVCNLRHEEDSVST